MSAQKTFSTSWTVRSASGVPPLRVQVPMTKGDPDPPEFLWLDARRRGIFGRLTPRPVLRTKRVASNEAGLAVSKSLKLTVKPSVPIRVNSASQNAYRWYRLSRFAGSAFAGAATIIGGLLVALGAIGPKSGLGQGLLFAGGGLLVAAAVTLVVSAWRAPA